MGNVQPSQLPVALDIHRALRIPTLQKLAGGDDVNGLSHILEAWRHTARAGPKDREAPPAGGFVPSPRNVTLDAPRCRGLGNPTRRRPRSRPAWVDSEDGLVVAVGASLASIEEEWDVVRAVATVLPAGCAAEQHCIADDEESSEHLACDINMDALARWWHGVADGSADLNELSRSIALGSASVEVGEVAGWEDDWLDLGVTPCVRCS
mmetsp:Transcript_32654/g.75915  ORF Transcript_32654/g.75915 Transcript_32654/m.75915 type:complete len:208 (-) Transcript_32654:130-753(-)